MKHATRTKIKKFFPIYVIAIISIVFLMNSYNVPTTTYNTGEVRIGVGAPSCGDSICSYGEDTTCCSDCGCEDGYECVSEQCTATTEVASAPHFSTPEFIITPETNDLTLTLNEEKILTYIVTNIDVVRIKVNLSVSEGTDFVTIYPIEFYLKPSEAQEVAVKVSPFEEFGDYSAQIQGEAGRSLVTSDINIDVVELGLFKKYVYYLDDYEELLSSFFKAKGEKEGLSLVWLIVPITIAIIFYFYVFRAKSTPTKHYKKK
jgi:hypothetical protein